MLHNDARAKGETVQEAARHSSKYLRRNMLWTALIIAGFFIYTMVSGPGMNIQCGTDRLSIAKPDKSVQEIYYAEIISCELVRGAEYGDMVEGKQTDKCWWGRWNNARWGDYTLCVRPGLESCIALELADTTCVISASTDDDTITLFKSISQNTGRP